MTLLKLLPEKVAEQARTPAYRLPFLIALLWILGLILAPFVDDLFTSAELSAGPVVDEVTIDRTEEVDGGTLFWGSFVKKRVDAFERVDWWLNTVPNVKVPLEIREGRSHVLSGGSIMVRGGFLCLPRNFSRTLTRSRFTTVMPDGRRSLCSGNPGSSLQIARSVID